MSNKINDYEAALTLLRSKGYSLKKHTELGSNEIKGLSVEDFSLSADENVEEIRELLGEGWVVNKLSNHGLITIDKKEN